MSITNKKHKPKAVFLHKPFDLNSSGKIDPAEAALMMMVFDDIENQINKEKVAAVPSHTPHTSHAIINLDDMDIGGI